MFARINSYKMLKHHLIYVTIVFSMFHFPESRSDCGCNKIKRSEIEIVKQKTTTTQNDDTTNEDENEICSESADTSQMLNLMHNDMIMIDDGEYTIGTNEPIFANDYEAPERNVRINKFYIDKYEVSNQNFKSFVDQTGYITYAEKFGDSFVFKGLLTESTQINYKDYRVANALWWYKINNTNWKHPEGEDSSIDDRMDHPVVHVSWFDAVEYCKWQNKRLPTESEWEVACRGGKKRKLYSWGNKLYARDQHWYVGITS